MAHSSHDQREVYKALEIPSQVIDQRQQLHQTSHRCFLLLAVLASALGCLSLLTPLAPHGDRTLTLGLVLSFLSLEFLSPAYWTSKTPRYREALTELQLQLSCLVFGLLVVSTAGSVTEETITAKVVALVVGFSVWASLRWLVHPLVGGFERLEPPSTRHSTTMIDGQLAVAAAHRLRTAIDGGDEQSAINFLKQCCAADQRPRQVQRAAQQSDSREEMDLAELQPRR